MIRAPEWWRRWRARVRGYFWLPCPICGQMFAGYEKGGGNLWETPYFGSMTCPRCPGDHYSPGYPEKVRTE